LRQPLGPFAEPESWYGPDVSTMTASMSSTADVAFYCTRVTRIEGKLAVRSLPYAGASSLLLQEGEEAVSIELDFMRH
jgi:hypothetical protein